MSLFVHTAEEKGYVDFHNGLENATSLKLTYMQMADPFRVCCFERVLANANSYIKQKLLLRKQKE